MRFLKKMLIPVVVLIIGFWLWGLKVPTEEYDLVIYGGGFAVIAYGVIPIKSIDVGVSSNNLKR